MKNILIQIHLFSGYAICFLFPVFQKIIPLLIALWGLSFLTFGYSKDFFKNIYKNKLTFFTLLFFIIHVIALLYTENLDSGKFDVESKLSFLIFPIILSNVHRYYTNNILKYILYSFVSGNLIASLICLSKAFYKWHYFDVPFQYFTYVDLSYFMHPTYFSMYICFSIVSIVYLLKYSQPKKLSKIFLVFTAFIFTLMIYLLSSKAGILVFIFLIFLMIISVIKKVRLRIIIIGSSAILMLVLFSFNNRFDRLIETVKYTVLSDENDFENLESTGQRIYVWKSATELIKENWLIGVSAGDLKYKLSETHYSEKFDSTKSKLLNAHNQYLETFLSVGIFGICLLLLWLIYPFFFINNEYRLLIIGLFIIIAINFIFESILNRQEGITFIGYFWLLLFSLNQQKRLEKI